VRAFAALFAIITAASFSLYPEHSEFRRYPSHFLWRGLLALAFSSVLAIKFEIGALVIAEQSPYRTSNNTKCY